MEDWIKCSDRLPEYSDGFCVVLWKGTVQHTLYRLINKETWQPVNEDEETAVVGEFSHWMPLPKPPE